MGIVFPIKKCIAQNGGKVPKNLTAYFGLCKFLNILSKFEKLRFFIAHPLHRIIIHVLRLTIEIKFKAEKLICLNDKLQGGMINEGVIEPWVIQPWAHRALVIGHWGHSALIKKDSVTQSPLTP